MRLAVEMAVMEMDGEWSAVAVGEDSAKFHGMLRLNESGAEIIKLLADDTTPEEVHQKLCEKYPDNIPGSFVVNGDKPLIQVGEEIVVFGTPWAGKEGTQRNTGIRL